MLRGRFSFFLKKEKITILLKNIDFQYGYNVRDKKMIHLRHIGMIVVWGLLVFSVGTGFASEVAKQYEKLVEQSDKFYNKKALDYFRSATLDQYSKEDKTKDCLYNSLPVVVGDNAEGLIPQVDLHTSLQSREDMAMHPRTGPALYQVEVVVAVNTLWKATHGCSKMEVGGKE